MNKLKLGVRLTGGFVIVAMFSLVLGILNLRIDKSLGTALDGLGNNALPYSFQLGVIRSEFNEMRAVQRSLLVADMTTCRIPASALAR